MAKNRFFFGLAAAGTLALGMGAGSNSAAEPAPELSSARGECSLAPSELQAHLGSDYESFDQALPNGGWRGLGAKGCHLEAGLLIDSYHLHNGAKLKGTQARVLYWHAGQAFAIGEAKSLAVTRFQSARNPDEPANDDFKWNAYVDGSIAFLKGDKNGLQAARDELAKASSARAKVNLDLLDRMLVCFGQSYGVIYSDQCRKP